MEWQAPEFTVSVGLAMLRELQAGGSGDIYLDLERLGDSSMPSSYPALQP